MPNYWMGYVAMAKLDERNLSIGILAFYLMTFSVILGETIWGRTYYPDSRVLGVQEYELVGLSQFIFHMDEVSITRKNIGTQSYCVPSSFLEAGIVGKKIEMHVGSLTGLMMQYSVGGQDYFLMTRVSVILSTIMALLWVLPWWREMPFAFIGALVQGYTCIWIFGGLLCQH